MNFVFLHTGIDPLPKLLVQSIRAQIKNANIIQCSNSRQFKIDGIDQLFIYEGNVEKLMTFRVESFSNLKLSEPAVYLDTDILISSTFNLEEMLESFDAAICERSFAKDAIFNANFKNLNLFEYRGKTLYEVYPYLASFNITKNHTFWENCLTKLEAIEEKFHFWYGDQEAIKFVVNKNKEKYKFLPEAEISCLPEYVNTTTMPKAIHFKGPSRKKLMPKFAQLIGLN